MNEKEKKALQALIDASHDARFVVEDGRLVLQLTRIEIRYALDSSVPFDVYEGDGWECDDSEEAGEGE